MMPLNDPTLLHLFHMGLFDWEGEDNHLHQTMQAMRHSTLLAGRIFDRLLKTQEQVFFPSALAVSHSDVEVLGGPSGGVIEDREGQEQRDPG